MATLITQNGVNVLDDAELAKTLDASKAGATLTAEQEQVANILAGAAPTQGNVFAPGSAPVNAPSPTKPILGTSTASDALAQPSDTTRRIQDFLGSLRVSDGLTSPAGSSLGPSGTATGPTVTGTGLDISKLLFPNFDLSAITGTGRQTATQGGGVTLGDATLSSEVENLRLQNERARLIDEQQSRHVQEAIKRGILPPALKVRGRGGELVNKPGDFGLSKADVPASLRQKLFPGPQVTGTGSIIGTSRPRSIIGR